MSLLDPLKTKALQFELWQECNNLCKFCYLGKENRVTKDEVKIKSLDRAYDSISDMSHYPEYNCISFIGGEFFQGQLKNPEVKEKFYKLLKKTAELYNNKIIEQVWLCCTLTLGDQHELYEILEFFNDYNGVWIATSWDIVGRFHNKRLEDNWKYHMKHLKELHPDIRLNTTIILSGVLIEEYIKNPKIFKNLMDEFDTTLFFKQPGSIIPWKSKGDPDEVRECKKKSNEVIHNFFPTRSRFLQFLIKFRNNESDHMWTRLFNIHYRAEDLHRQYNSGKEGLEIRSKVNKAEQDTLVKSPCGHVINYASYIDCDGCVLCDKIKISELSE